MEDETVYLNPDLTLTGLLPIVKLYAHIKYDSAYSGVIQFKNVPVQWDVEY